MACDAHVGGFVFGVLVGLVVRAVRPVRAMTWRNQYTDPRGGPLPF